MCPITTNYYRVDNWNQTYFTRREKEKCLTDIWIWTDGIFKFNELILSYTYRIYLFDIVFRIDKCFWCDIFLGISGKRNKQQTNEKEIPFKCQSYMFGLH